MVGGEPVLIATGAGFSNVTLAAAAMPGRARAAATVAMATVAETRVGETRGSFLTTDPSLRPQPTQVAPERRAVSSGASRARTGDLLGAMRGGVGASEDGESALTSGSWSVGSPDVPARIPVDYRRLGWIWAPELGWCPIQHDDCRDHR
jgi:hypothetical protein